MNDECSKYIDVYVPYINRQLNTKQNSEVIYHLAGCPKCRTELAYLIRISNTMKAKMRKTPEALKQALLDQVKVKARQRAVTVDDVMQYLSPKVIRDIIQEPLEPLRKTMQYILQNI